MLIKIVRVVMVIAALASLYFGVKGVFLGETTLGRIGSVTGAAAIIGGIVYIVIGVLVVWGIIVTSDVWKRLSNPLFKEAKTENGEKRELSLKTKIILISIVALSIAMITVGLVLYVGSSRNHPTNMQIEKIKDEIKQYQLSSEGTNMALEQMHEKLEQLESASSTDGGLLPSSP